MQPKQILNKLLNLNTLSLVIAGLVAFSCFATIFLVWAHADSGVHKVVQVKGKVKNCMFIVDGQEHYTNEKCIYNKGDNMTVYKTNMGSWEVK